jgi:hypothetical protein
MPDGQLVSLFSAGFSVLHSDKAFGTVGVALCGRARLEWR